MSDSNNNVTRPTRGYNLLNFGKGMSIASLVLGICGLIAWYNPLFGYPIAIVGIILGIIGKKKGGKRMAIAGIICSAISLVATLANSIAGALLLGGYFDK